MPRFTFDENRTPLAGSGFDIMTIFSIVEKLCSYTRSLSYGVYLSAS